MKCFKTIKYYQKVWDWHCFSYDNITLLCFILSNMLRIPVRRALVSLSKSPKGCGECLFFEFAFVGTRLAVFVNS